ncbi:lysophospholipid acyltransferase family protein [Candidatus Riflebacteria bacterium]
MRIIVKIFLSGISAISCLITRPLLDIFIRFISLILLLFSPFQQRLKTDLRLAFHAAGKPFPRSWPVLIYNIIYHHICLIFEFLRLENFHKTQKRPKIKYDFEIFKKNGGGLILVPHLGNWELLGTQLCDQGFPLGALYLENDNDFLARITHFFRSKSRIKLFNRKNELRQAVEHLKRGGLLGLINDQDGTRGGIFHDFFDRQVSSPVGPAYWQAKFKCNVFLLYCIRKSFENFEMYAEILCKKGEKMSPFALNILINQKYEEIIINNPENWLWMYNRWKIRHHSSLVELNPCAHKKSGRIKGRNGSPRTFRESNIYFKL